MSYIDFPPLQMSASYNLTQVLQEVREMETPERVTNGWAETNNGRRLARAAGHSLKNTHRSTRVKRAGCPCSGASAISFSNELAKPQNQTSNKNK